MPVATLFKYGALSEHSEALFAESTVWFSSAEKLNDPFELRPWFTFEGTDEQVVQVLTRAIQKRSPGITLINALKEALEIIQQGQHRNPETWDELRRDVLAKIAREVGVYCMSTHGDSILMWSHYAKNHEGYCLEFAATDDTPFFGEAQEVKYGTKFPIVDFFNTPPEQQVDPIFLTKFEGWRYESEYRIVDHQSGPGIHAYPKELLVSVTFGLRMIDADKAKISMWLAQRGHPVALYQATIDDRRFKVVRTRIE